MIIRTLDIQNGNRVIRIANDRYEDMMKQHFELYFNAVEPVEENGKLVVDYSRPNWHTYKHNHQSFLLASFPEEGVIIDEYFRHAPSGSLAFDIGAYCGLSTYEMSKRFKKVVAFEPDPLNLGCLYTNLYGIPNVQIVPHAIMGESGRVDFIAEGTTGGSAWMARSNPEFSIKVGSLSLAAACALYGIPDFISMDIEMNEVEALEGARPLLRSENIGIVVDTCHGEPNTSLPVEKILKECGYKVETDYLHGLSTTYGWKD